MTNDDRMEACILRSLRNDPVMSQLPFSYSAILEPLDLFDSLRLAHFEEEPPSLNDLRSLASSASQSQNQPDIRNMLHYITADDREKIYSLVDKFRDACAHSPFCVATQAEHRSPREIIEMLATVIQRFVYFTSCIAEFKSLGESDQTTLLRTSILELCILRGAVCFDAANNRWQNPNVFMLADCPQLNINDIQPIMTSGLFSKYIKFFFEIQLLRVDETVGLLASMIALFSPEHASLLQRPRVRKFQHKYLMLLHKYVVWQHGVDGTLMYAEILAKLRFLRELVDFHNEKQFNLQREDINSLKRAFAILNTPLSGDQTTEHPISTTAADYHFTSSTTVSSHVDAMHQYFSDCQNLPKPKRFEPAVEEKPIGSSTESLSVATRVASETQFQPLESNTFSESASDDPSCIEAAISNANLISMMSAISTNEFLQPAASTMTGDSYGIQLGPQQSMCPFSSNLLAEHYQTLPYLQNQQSGMQTSSFQIASTQEEFSSWTATAFSCTSYSNSSVTVQGTEREYASDEMYEEADTDASTNSD